ncbi:hypothetical protein, partial [Prevotella melaninogenica]|uniref:hypothetical protein n=1 Tax=Prevotella melaninogenica TaxID=28132 RepID=UPI003C7714C7
MEHNKLSLSLYWQGVSLYHKLPFVPQIPLPRRGGIKSLSSRDLLFYKIVLSFSNITLVLISAKVIDKLLL